MDFSCPHRHRKRPLENLLLIFGFLFVSANASAQFFQKFYGENGVDEGAVGVHQFPTGSIFLLSNVTAGTSGGADVKVYKLDEGGEVLWVKEFGTVDDDFAADMVVMGSQIYIVGERNFSDDSKSGFVLTIDTFGNEVSNDFFSHASKSIQFNSIAINNDEIYVTGFITGVGFGNDVFVKKLPLNDGWERSFGDTLNEVGNSIGVFPNGNLVVACDNQREDYKYNVDVYCLDPAGGLVWYLDIPIPYNGGSKRLIINKKGNAVIVGEMSSPTSIFFDMYIVEVTPSGDKVLEKWISGTEKGEAGFGVCEIGSGNYLLAGYGHNAVTEKTDIPVVSVSATGEVVERKFFGGDQFDIAYDIQPSLFGGFVLAGASNQPDAVKSVLVFDQIALATTTKNRHQIENLIISVVYDGQKVKAGFSRYLPEGVHVSIVDATGKIHFSSQINYSFHEIECPITLTSGVYFLQIQHENLLRGVAFYAR